PPRRITIAPMKHTIAAHLSVLRDIVILLQNNVGLSERIARSATKLNTPRKLYTAFLRDLKTFSLIYCLLTCYNNRYIDLSQN
ncbi:MAG: hypothetical protein PVI06_15290, partial [Desulfobacterales bacterium]